ncbi:MAG: response regulator [Elusimicrobia bacterium]|nr:response regulator [Elusimicrobiota bacterium]
MRVLIVDDNDVARHLIRHILQSHGHQVAAEAEDLEGALKAYEAHRPDVVTLDLSLAHDDGLDVLKALRQKDARAKVLIVSANSQRKVRDQVMAAGACGMLSKAFGEEELLDALASAVPSRGRSSAPAGLELDEPGSKALLKVIAGGATEGAERLAAMSRAPWKVETVSLGAQCCAGPDAAEHYGAYSFMPGGAFLTLFTRKGAAAIAEAYLPPAEQIRKGLEEFDRSAAAEISNIVVNALSTALVDACQMSCFLSAPRMSFAGSGELISQAVETFGLGDPKFITACARMNAPSLPSDCVVVVLLNSRFVKLIMPLVCPA